MDLLDETGKIEVGAIVRRLVVSPATARRDLDFLAERRVLTRTHGGAMARSLAQDLPIRLTKTQLSAAEAGIARAASDLVPRGTVIGLSSGTTATAIAEALLSSDTAVIRNDILQRKQALDGVLTESGLRIAGGSDLFTLVHVADAAVLHERLCRHHILVRRFDYDPHWLRFGLTPDAVADRRLSAALSSSLAA